jgi:hypothetical protein
LAQRLGGGRRAVFWLCKIGPDTLKENTEIRGTKFECHSRHGGRPVARRPTLYAPHREGGRHATWLELFFDLVFVLAIAELPATSTII